MGREVSFCWHCNRQLVRKKGGGFKYTLLKDPIGNEMRVHKDCAKEAVDERIKVAPNQPT